MHFKTLAANEFRPEVIASLIALFERNGESGPHSTEGRLLSHILNHCVANDIPFTVMFVPKAGYYVKRAYPDNFVPTPIVDDLKAELQAVESRTGDEYSDTYGMLYDMETLPDTKTRGERFLEVIETSKVLDGFLVETGHDVVRITRIPVGDYDEQS